MKTNWIQRDIIKLNAKILAPLWKNYIKTDMEKLKQMIPNWIIEPKFKPSSIFKEKLETV